MLIFYQTLDLKKKVLDIGNVVGVVINEIKLKEIEGGLQIAVEECIVVKPNASNSIDVTSNKY